MRYKVGTRGSPLSQAQTTWAISELKRRTDADFEVVAITTKGDTDARPLFTINQKGIFEKEVDKAVADKQVDFAVHSLKDIPVVLPDELVLACIPKRESPNDILISKDAQPLGSLKKGGVVGTSSLRRAIQITRLRPDLIVKPIRGNIETRIRKVEEKIFDAIVLAEAGILRLGLDLKYERLSINDFPPSPGQGALGIVTRKDNHELIEFLKTIEDPQSRNAIEAERFLSTFLDSGCRFPVGALAQQEDDRIHVFVIVYSVDGTKSIRLEKTASLSHARDLCQDIAKELESKGIQELAKNWREKVEQWNAK